MCRYGREKEPPLYEGIYQKDELQTYIQADSELESFQNEAALKHYPSCHECFCE